MQVIVDDDGNIRRNTFVGVFPVRTDIEVIPADEPKKLKLGWTVTETIGVAVINPRALKGLRFKKHRVPITIDDDGNIG